jgi:hypothetical protein
MRSSFFLLLLLPFLSLSAQQQNSFYASGFLQYSYHEKNGQLDGEFVSYYENGLVKASGSFAEGQKQGTWKAWDTTGILRSKRFYRNNHDFDLLAEWGRDGENVDTRYLQKKKKELVARSYRSSDIDILYFQRYWNRILPGENNKELFSENFYGLIRNEIAAGRVIAFADDRFVNPLPAGEAAAFVNTIPGEYMLKAERQYYTSWQQMTDRMIGLGLRYKDNKEDKTIWLYVPDLLPVLDKYPGTGSLVADKLTRSSFETVPDMTTYMSKGNLPRKVGENEKIALLLAEIDFETGAWVYLIDRDLYRERK